MRVWSVTVLGAVALLPMSAEASHGAEDGFRYRLFDGETLSGWTVENDCGVEIRDGLLVLESGNGWVRSHHQYGDFRLHVEWKALQKDDYDAGIYLRTQRGGRPFPETGYQLNLLQGREGEIAGLPGAEGRSDLVKPAGEWNTFEVAVVGDRVELSMNGTSAYTAEGLAVSEGFLGFQVEVPTGGRFLLRNVQVTELHHRSLFNGKDLSGWDGAGGPAGRCWTVEDGELVGLKKKGPWLRSRERWGDFNLRLEYQVESRANSGIYVRVPPNGRHHRKTADAPPAGFEVQILDDSSPRHAHLKDYQYCGSLYGLVPAGRRVSHPPGRWNTMEIDCRGHRVTVVHNGQTIVGAGPEEFPLLGLRQLRGHLGLQNHGGGVRFRRIRIATRE